MDVLEHEWAKFVPEKMKMPKSLSVVLRMMFILLQPQGI